MTTQTPFSQLATPVVVMNGAPGARDATGNLTVADLAMLAASWITPELARQARIRRVNSLEGAEAVGRKQGPDYSGVLFSYVRPGTDYCHAERLRVDHAPVEIRNGETKPAYKYLTAAGRGNNLYFMPGTPPGHLQDVRLDIAVTEGEKKGIALYRASREGLPESSERPRFLPIALPGVQSWRGKIGRRQTANGSWVEERGPIADLDRITWTGRRVVIVFDSNVATNSNVFFARLQLAAELTHRGANVHLADVPEEVGINGIDDYLAKYGLESALELINTARLFKPSDRLAALDYTDAGNEEAFELLHGDDFLYNRTADQWLFWDANLWVPDRDGSADRRMLEVAHARLQAIQAIVDDPLAYGNTGDARKNKKRAFKEAIKLRNVRGRQSALLSATTNPRFARRAEDFDQDPYLFGCGNGVLDLKSGEFRPGRREDYITMRTQVPWIEGAAYDRWLKFLSEVFPDRPDMLEYLQRAIGYSLTGLTQEECFWILHGSGRNGKGVFLRVLSEVLGDYANTCEFSTLVADSDRGAGRPRNDIAALAGKRFVTAQEAREGCQLDESLIKSLTGGDLITARFLHHEFFTFHPTWKIWLATNHRPEIRGSDTGIWSRPRLIPFTVCFEGRENRGLKAELMQTCELAGVLRWAVEGCRNYLADGLKAPDEVVAATAEYRAESDVIGRFVEECCISGEYAQVKARQLYQAFAKWADAAGEKSLTETAFGRRVVERGFDRKKLEGSNVYLRIGLLDMRCSE